MVDSAALYLSMARNQWRRPWLEKPGGGGDREGSSPPGPIDSISWVEPGKTQYIPNKMGPFYLFGLFFSNCNSYLTIQFFFNALHSTPHAYHYNIPSFAGFIENLCAVTVTAGEYPPPPPGSQVSGANGGRRPSARGRVAGGSAGEGDGTWHAAARRAGVCESVSRRRSAETGPPPSRQEAPADGDERVRR